MRILIFSFIIVSFFLPLSSCTNLSGNKEKPTLIVKHVFTNGLPSPYSGFRSTARSDYYYVYNYTDADYRLFEKMLDTLFIDTTYSYHGYLFLQYDEDLPDTMALRNEMEGRICC